MNDSYKTSEKVKFYESELQKKDELIFKLSKIEVDSNDNCSSISANEAGLSREQITNIKSKLCQLQKTIDDNKIHFIEKDMQLQEILSKNKRLTLENNDYLQKITELEEQLQNDDNALKQYSSIHSRNQIALQSLQEELKCKKNHICDLIDKINYLKAIKNDEKFASENEIAEHKKGMNMIARILKCSPTYDTCREYIKSLICAKACLESQANRLQDCANTFEFEQRAARETTLRLSGELNKEITAKEAAVTELKKANLELTKTRSKLEASEANVRLLSCRIQSLTEALDKAHNEAELREAELLRIAGCDASNNGVHPGSPATMTSKAVVHKRQFLDDEHSLHDFLNFARHYLKASKEDSSQKLLQRLKDKLTNLEVNPPKDNSSMRNLEMMSSATPATNRAKEAKIVHLQNIIEQLHQEREEINQLNQRNFKEKEQLQTFMTKVSDQLKLDGISAANEMPLLMDAITARVKSLISGEGERIANQRVKISKMQQQLRELKDKNDSLELQASLLRRRTTESVESREQIPLKSPAAAALVSAEREKRRLSKQLEQTKAEFQNLQSENVQLRTQLLDVNPSSIEAIGTSKVIHLPEAKFVDIPRTIDHLAEEQNCPQKSVSPSGSQKMRTIATMTSHVHGNGREFTALDDVRKSEKQLLKFRSTVARMLGLDCEQLAVPDVQIVDELERVLRLSSRESIDADLFSSYRENC